jgi:hypothetical protein
MDLTIDEPSPMNARMLVIALFHDESTIRVYEVPVNAAPDDKPLMPRRVSLTKSSVVGNETFVIEDMTLERMADVLADELSVLEGAVTTSERERNAMLDYGRALPPEYPLRDFLADIEAEEHIDDDDESELPSAAQADGSAG